MGRTRQIEFDRKVELAVIAFARHQYTEYEQRLTEVWSDWEYDELRSEIKYDVDEVVEKWRMPNEELR